ncbi:MAG: ParA family protein [Nitrospirae bacterium]|nr:ParA family protein [Nitrospirota bacterium]
MKQVVSVVNLKGGVGKTTTAVNLAACWAEQGKKVLLVDLDPQGSASICVGIMSKGRRLLDAMQKIIALPVVPTGVTGLDLVPSGPELAAARQIFVDGPGDEIFASCLRQTTGDWDCVIIDCPPSLDVLTMSSLLASQHVIVPVEASFLGLNGVRQMRAAVESAKSRNAELDIRAIIPCRAQPRRRIHWEIMDRLNEMFPGKVSPIIHENVSLAEAPGRGTPVIISARISRGSDDYRLVSLWLAEHVGLEEKQVIEFSHDELTHPMEEVSSL